MILPPPPPPPPLLLLLPEQGRTPAAAQHVYMKAIAACRARHGSDRPGFSERVERAVKASRQIGTEPNAEVMCRVATACVQGNKWERAAAIFEKLVRHARQVRPVSDGGG